jgi:hypothetical protein
VTWRSHGLRRERVGGEIEVWDFLSEDNTLALGHKAFECLGPCLAHC